MSEVVHPCIGWSLPKSSDTDEQTLTIQTEDFKVDVTRGPIKVTYNCTAMFLALKSDYDGESALVRPLLPRDIDTHSSAEGKEGQEG